jgi:hypothetical protein
VGGRIDLLRALDPELRPGRFVFVSLPTVPTGIEPMATIREPEGVSMVLPAENAEAMGLPFEFEAAMITLRVDSALDAVGLTASVSSALADAGIPCNVVAGYHHDHLFVPHAFGEEAVGVLTALADRT